MLQLVLLQLVQPLLRVLGPQVLVEPLVLGPVQGLLQQQVPVQPVPLVQQPVLALERVRALLQALENNDRIDLHTS